jgi:hypothetical protein
MSDYFYDGIMPNYTIGTKNIKIDPTNNTLTISDSSINKVLNINSQQLSNNSGQSLLFSDIYTTVNKTPAITYPSTNSTTLNVNNTITLTNGTTTNTLNQSDWTGTIKTQNSTQNLTHYLNMSDASTTGQGNPQKSSLITANPSTGNVAATTFTGALTGNSSSASTIALTSDNTSGTYFVPFSKTIDPSTNTLYIDNVIGPLTYNPNNSTLTAAIFSGVATTATNVTTTDNNTATTYYLPFVSGVSGSTGLLVDTITGPLTYVPSSGLLTATTFVGDIQTSNSSNLAGFAAGVLSYSPGLVSYRCGTVTITGTSNAISSLSLTNVRNNGVYYIAIQNNGSLALTIQTGLGANIKTTYSSVISVGPGGSALMSINIITLNSVQTTIVGVSTLT